MRPQLKFFAKLSVVTLLLLVGFLITGSEAGSPTEPDPSESPLQKFRIVIDENLWPRYYQKLEQFATDNGFKIWIEQVRPEPSHKVAELWQGSIVIISTHLQEKGVFFLGIYASATSMPPPDKVDEARLKLQSMVTSIPGTMSQDEN